MRASIDFPKVSCNGCATTYESEGEEPKCFDGKCDALIDLLSEESLRILNIRGILLTLNEMGLAPKVANLFDLTQDDLFTLAWIEMEMKRLRPEPEAT